MLGEVASSSDYWELHKDLSRFYVVLPRVKGQTWIKMQITNRSPFNNFSGTVIFYLFLYSDLPHFPIFIM